MISLILKQVLLYVTMPFWKIILNDLAFHPKSFVSIKILISFNVWGFFKIFSGIKTFRAKGK